MIKTTDIQIEVGWGYLYDNDLITINFHMKFDIYQWKEVITLDKLSLFNSLKYIVNNNKFEFPIVNINEKIILINKLLETKFIRNDIVEIEYYRFKIEYWINYLIQFVNDFDIETQNFIKENWFYSQVEHQNIFQNLLLIKDEIPNNNITTNDNNKIKKNILKFHKFHLFRLNKPKKNNKEYGTVTEDTLTNNITTNKSNYNIDINNNNINRGYQNSVQEKPVTFYKHVKKYAQSSSSDVNKKHVEFIDEMINETTATRKPTAVLKIEVTKGQQIRTGLHVYIVYLRVTGKEFKEPLVHRIFQRYSTFKKLYLKLIDINNEIVSTHQPHHLHYPSSSAASVALSNKSTAIDITTSSNTSSRDRYLNFMVMITSTFPGAPLKSMIGLSLNNDELKIRTAALDRWFRDLCYHYRQMPSKARIVIREFLNFDLSNSKDILIYDQLAWGIIDYYHISNNNNNSSKSHPNRENQNDENPTIVLVSNSGLFHILSNVVVDHSDDTSYPPSEEATTTISMSMMDKLDIVSSNTSKASKSKTDERSRMSLVRTYS